MKRCLFLCLISVMFLSGCIATQVTVPEVKITDLSLDEALAKDLSNAELCKVFSNQFTVRVADGRFHAVLDILPVCVRKMSVDDSCKVTATLFHDLLKQKKFDDLERLTDYVQNMFPNRAGLQELCVVSEIDYLAETARLDKAVTMLLAQARELSDRNMQDVVRRLLSKAKGKRDLVLTERICEFVASKTHGRPMTLDAVAVQWVMLASEETDQAPSRLSRLLAAGAKPLSVARAYTRVGSRILIGSDKELFSQMMQVGQSLLSMISDKDKRLDVARLMFDYSCIQEDYEASLDLLRTCYEGKKIDHILNKVQAHKALKEGRSDEAVKRFRDFMDLVRTWKTKQYDQLTGESVPVSAVLGLNARRIGDILLLDGKKKEAAKAYAEAKEYYAKALGSLEKAPRWKADVEKAIKDLEAK